MAKTEKMKSRATEIIGKIRAFLMDNIELKSLFSGETSQKEMDEEVRQMIVKQRGTILSLLANTIELKNLCSEDDNKQTETDGEETEFPKIQRSNRVIDSKTTKLTLLDSLLQENKIIMQDEQMDKNVKLMVKTQTIPDAIMDQEDKNLSNYKRLEDKYNVVLSSNERLLGILALKDEDNQTCNKLIALKGEEIKSLKQTNEQLLSFLAMKNKEIETLTNDLKDSNGKIQTLEEMLFLEHKNLSSHARNIVFKEEGREDDEEGTVSDGREKRGAIDKEKRIVINEEKTEERTEKKTKDEQTGDDNVLDFKTKNKKEKRGRKQQKKNKERRRFSFSPCSQSSKSSKGIWASGSSDGHYKVWSSQSSNQNYDFPDWRSKTSDDYGIWRNRVSEWRQQEAERKARYELWVRENDSNEGENDGSFEEGNFKEQYDAEEGSSKSEKEDDYSEEEKDSFENNGPYNYEEDQNDSLEEESDAENHFFNDHDYDDWTDDGEIVSNF